MRPQHHLSLVVWNIIFGGDNDCEYSRRKKVPSN